MQVLCGDYPNHFEMSSRKRTVDKIFFPRTIHETVSKLFFPVSFKSIEKIFINFRGVQWNSPKNAAKPGANWTPQPMAATTGVGYRPMVSITIINRIN